jgi:hypothetical protein
MMNEGRCQMAPQTIAVSWKDTNARQFKVQHELRLKQLLSSGSRWIVSSFEPWLSIGRFGSPWLLGGPLSVPEINWKRDVSSQKGSHNETRS